ncbi:hypothetical protein UB43_05085 [Pseudomonas sp. 21]|uniref:hypothetical protein n=1 Tax=unclassified Pseudomonas TaxID=196821 RepID=UPI0005EBD109|nr:MULTISPECIES: hypothetical protein [unclassified Pseudomonas]KJK02663.1 hypothetical protein UB43_05085 [Pseudomonas sp. 21]MBV7585539.1 hypothetical protein [Pseudomonas sp. PDM33]
MNEPQRVFSSITPRENGVVAGGAFGTGLCQRVRQWRLKRLLRLALRIAEEPILMLEVSQSPGATWPVLLEHGNRIIVATCPSSDALAEAHQRLPEAMKRRIRDLPAPHENAELRKGSVDCLLLPEVPQSACNRQNIRLLNQWIPVTRDSAILFARVDHSSPAVPADQACPCGPDPHPGGPDFASARALEREFQRLGFSQIRHYNVIPGVDGVRVYILRK